MALTVEIIKEFVGPKKLGILSPSRPTPFTNYTPEGEKELIVFRSNPEGTKTQVFKRRKWSNVVNPKDLDSDDYVLEKTLVPGDEYYIVAGKNIDGNKTKTIRFTQDEEVFSDISTNHKRRGLN